MAADRLPRSRKQGLAGFLETTDPTGTFEHMHTIPVRQNRSGTLAPRAAPSTISLVLASNPPGPSGSILVYSGHIPHSAYFPPAAAKRMLAGEGRRVMLQHFVPVVSLEAWELGALKSL